ncbi:MAG TPA: ATP-binding protein [Acidimicrobiales bacterium]|jgi:two-component system sensor histidine kinase KdpD|nr:ATP-binding protein [Acidimicrobiales bacterium]
MARGTLRIYLGAAPGVGKTYAMLNEGWRRNSRGTDVVVGYVETHDRANTAAQLRELPVQPRTALPYRDQVLEEMDVDTLLARHPDVVLVDELAHTNVPGSRNEKRWQDVDELLDAGINVISTVNIQHLESINDVVERITGVVQRETVPDAIVRAADQIELVDMHPEALRRRMAHGNIYPAERADAALSHYFRVGNLAALRELALLWVTDRVDEELAEYRTRYGIDDPWETKERVVVGLTGAPGSDHLLRRAARIAARANGELIGLHIRSTDGYAHVSGDLDEQRRLLADLGGRYAEVTGADIAQALVHFARAENATQIVLGATAHSRWREVLRGSIINRVARDARGVDVHIISRHDEDAHLPSPPRHRRPVTVTPRRRNLALAMGTVGMVSVASGLSTFRSTLGFPGALLCLLLVVAAVAVVGGLVPAAVASIVGALMGDFFFTRPFHSFYIDNGTDIVAVLVFLAVAAVLSVLIDRLARRSLQVARAQAEAEALARLAGRSVVSGAEALPNLVAELRRVFDLDGAAIVTRSGDGWTPIASAGAEVVPNPDEAPFAAELDERTMLVLSGEALRAEDTRLLAGFVSQLRQTQERMQLEEDAATATELAEANSLRGAILAAVSHDLRTPLSSIKAAATSLLSNDVDWDPNQAKNFAKTIDSESDRLTHLVANLLDMSRLQAGALPIHVRAVPVEDALYDAVAALGADGSRVVVDIAGELPSIEVDPGLLERSVANVLSNAINWSPPDHAVRVEAAVRDAVVEIHVVDQGPGVAADRREALFQPFQRLGDGAGGSPDGVGLGLAVAHGFTRAMGGQLLYEDTPGGGATFVFQLRRADR